MFFFFLGNVSVQTGFICKIRTISTTYITLTANVINNSYHFIWRVSCLFLSCKLICKLITAVCFSHFFHWTDGDHNFWLKINIIQFWCPFSGQNIPIVFWCHFRGPDILFDCKAERDLLRWKGCYRKWMDQFQYLKRKSILS